MDNRVIAVALTGLVSLVACSKVERDPSVDALLEKLHMITMEDKVLFGQANPTTITYLDRTDHKNIDIGDCKAVTGDNPALYESDIMWYRDTAFMRRDIEAMKLAASKGCVVGYCWHLGGKLTGDFNAFIDGMTSPDCDLVHLLLEDTCRAENVWLNWLYTEIDKRLLPVLRQFDTPVYFRPWHEMNGNWFWWGTTGNTPDDYKALYRLTVDYIRSRGIRNVYFVWACDKVFAEQYYPGDDYVDVLGIDIYEPGIKSWGAYDTLLPEIARMLTFASNHDKLAAITEVGCRKEYGDKGAFLYPDVYPNFWSENVLANILEDPRAKGLSWVMSWYGADWSGIRDNVMYIPYIGCTRPKANEAMKDFRQFIRSTRIVTQTDMSAY